MPSSLTFSISPCSSISFIVARFSPIIIFFTLFPLDFWPRYLFLTLNFYKEPLLYTSNNSEDYTFCPVCITNPADISMLTWIMCCVHLGIWPNFSTLECITVSVLSWQSQDNDASKSILRFEKNRKCSDDKRIDLRKIQHNKTVMVQNYTGLTSIQSSLLILSLQSMDLTTLLATFYVWVVDK